MNKYVKELKSLLEEGFKITKIKFEMKKERNKDIMINTVILKKGEEEKTIKSKNSSEFYNYIGNFQKVKDQYDNFHFIYVENLKEIKKKQIQKEPQQVLKENHKLKISGRLFSEGVITINLTPAGPQNKKGFAEFWIELDKNLDFNLIDFKDEIEVYDINENLVFKGYILRYEEHNNIAMITIQDFSLKLESEKMSLEFGNMLPQDSIKLIVESQGFTFQTMGLNLPVNNNLRDFVIILPVQNLIINDEFKIGKVTFYQIFDSHDDEIIRKSDTGRKELIWSGNFPRAKIIIKSKSFYEALLKGFSEISKSIDVMSLRTDLSIPNIKIKDKKNNFNYSYFKNLVSVKIPRVVYCREKDTLAHTFFNLDANSERVLSLELEPMKYFEEITKLFEDLLIKENLTQKEKNIFQSLHWLRRAMQEGKNKDKLIDLWTSLEFLVSGTKVKKEFSKDDKKIIEDFVNESGFSEVQKRAILSKINMLNDSPLMIKFNSLTELLNIQFSEEELEVLKSTRRKRNELIHGLKDIEVENSELNKLRTIIEKIIINKVGNFL
jgi:hypothetical protein